jgi:hypothetical protein
LHRNPPLGAPPYDFGVVPLSEEQNTTSPRSTVAASIICIWWSLLLVICRPRRNSRL